jgi:2-oxo-3-hexenedioate decarboxylase
MGANEGADFQNIAREVAAALASHRQIGLFSSRPAGLILAQAYRVTSHLRAAFEARGEAITGRKIGFTNRDMWKMFGVDSPIWGYCTDRTTSDLSAIPTVRVKDFIAPRIEPEVIFGLGRAPAHGMDEEALLDCIAWISLGYEVVQSIFPGWKFTAPDTVAANGLHGALLIGRRHAVAPRKALWREELATFKVELLCNGKLSQRGGGALVLDSPLLALRHLVDLLAEDTNNPPLAAGDIVTTGTLKLAMPVAAGESWTTKASGIQLEDVTLGFA